MSLRLSDLGKRKHASELTTLQLQSIGAPRWRLIEDEGKSAVEPANSDERRGLQLRCRPGLTAPGSGHKRSALAMAAQGQALFVAAGIDDREPDPLSFEGQ